MADSKLALTPDGVGPIRHAFDPDLTTLQKLFPGYTVAKGSYYQGEKLQSGSYQVSKEGKLVLTVQRTHEGGIEVAAVGGAVSLPGGAKLGSSYAAVARKLGKKLACESGMEELSDNLVCTAEGLDRIRWIFAPPDTKPPETGPYLSTAKREDFVLSSVRWTLVEKQP